MDNNLILSEESERAIFYQRVMNLLAQRFPSDDEFRNVASIRDLIHAAFDVSKNLDGEIFKTKNQ